MKLMLDIVKKDLIGKTQNMVDKNIINIFHLDKAKIYMDMNSDFDDTNMLGELKYTDENNLSSLKFIINSNIFFNKENNDYNSNIEFFVKIIESIYKDDTLYEDMKIDELNININDAKKFREKKKESFETNILNLSNYIKNIKENNITTITLYCNGEIKFNDSHLFIELKYNKYAEDLTCSGDNVFQENIINYFFGDKFKVYDKDGQTLTITKNKDSSGMRIGGKLKSRKYKKKMHTKKRKSHKKRSMRKKCN